MSACYSALHPPLAASASRCAMCTTPTACAGMPSRCGVAAPQTPRAARTCPTPPFSTNWGSLPCNHRHPPAVLSSRAACPTRTASQLGTAPTPARTSPTPPPALRASSARWVGREGCRGARFAGLRPACRLSSSLPSQVPRLCLPFVPFAFAVVPLGIVRWELRGCSQVGHVPPGRRAGRLGRLRRCGGRPGHPPLPEHSGKIGVWGEECLPPVVLLGSFRHVPLLCFLPHAQPPAPLLACRAAMWIGP